ncbi:hypothetical protein [Parasitella parasitica]|uniref:Transmembrane protein n=1 Tax=Parasitella parasitica TaxID=35722 RepID=A0A0B7NKP4_9FUNG|nr:hypothetical protein [Parasitella parasitica]
MVKSTAPVSSSDDDHKSAQPSELLNESFEHPFQDNNDEDDYKNDKPVSSYFYFSSCKISFSFVILVLVFVLVFGFVLTVLLIFAASIIAGIKIAIKFGFWIDICIIASVHNEKPKAKKRSNTKRLMENLFWALVKENSKRDIIQHWPEKL